MTTTEGLLIAVVIVLVVLMARRQQLRGPSRVRTWDCVDRETGDITAVSMKYQHGLGCKCNECRNPEGQTLMDNIEHFDPSNSTPGCPAENTCDDKLTYAVDPFGAPDMDFKDYIASQSVDQQVIKNHAEFVKDRMSNNSQNITGRTFSPGELEADQVTWWGIRGRPQSVPYYNPTQVPDVDKSWYSQKPKLSWASS